MNGVTMKGTELKGTMPASPSVETVPYGKNLNGQTNQGVVTCKKSSEKGAFSTPKQAGSVKGSLA